MMTIFYSWQSDIDGDTNRFFIFNALKSAAKNLKSEAGFDIIIDQATREEPGTPDIPDTILKKIDECAIFVADISFINGKTAKRRTPNPNVLLELGYAVKKLGFEKIITIFNDEFGKPEELPFDIKNRRPMQYKYNKSMDKKEALNSLTGKLENAILLIDRKTMTKEKVDFVFYDRDEGKQYGKSCAINGVVYKRLMEDDFLRGIDFDVIRKIKNEKKLTEWQEYLYDEKKKQEERKAALASMSGMAIINEWSYNDPGETKDYYNKYMVSSLMRLDNCKLDFLIRNNNEHSMKNIKIVLKTEKKNELRRSVDFPDLPQRSTFADLAFRIPRNTEQVLFQKKEDGDYVIFEYMKENLYADEEYVLDEPLYVFLQESGLIRIEYIIFSENLQKINGVLEINMMNEARELSPIDVFCKL
jgi:hypothetical protein